jgi:hypothetical protein
VGACEADQWYIRVRPRLKLLLAGASGCLWPFVNSDWLFPSHAMRSTCMKRPWPRHDKPAIPRATYSVWPGSDEVYQFCSTQPKVLDFEPQQAGRPSETVTALVGLGEH